MIKFFNGSDQAFTELEQQARTAAYVNFPNVELPPGAVPRRSRIGFKTDSATGVSTLFVEMGVRYYGGNPSIRRWLQDGQASFPTFADLRRWICSELKAEFDKPVEVLAVLGPEPGASNAEPAAAHPEPTAEPAPVDPLVTTLVQFLIQQMGRKHGLDVQRVDPALLTALCQRLRGETGDACTTTLTEILGAPFALASVQAQAQGGSAVAIRAGPPISCEFLSTTANTNKPNQPNP